MNLKDHLSVPYSEISQDAKDGLVILQRALDDPQTQLANRFIELWSETLTSGDKNWLQFTKEGNKEMWRRLGLAHDLAARLASCGTR